MPLMQCGCTSQGTDKDGNPVCVVHFPSAAARFIEFKKPDLSNRVARCAYCHAERPSKIGLAFFSHQPEKKLDQFYCGCRGWE